MMTSFKS